jgi:hypothetical protein
VPRVIVCDRGTYELGIRISDGEIHEEAVGLDDVGQQARVGASRHEAALGAHLAAREPRDRRADLRYERSSSAVRNAARAAATAASDPEQQLAGLDMRALVVEALEQDARDARAYFDFAHPAKLRRILEVERQCARLDHDDSHFDGRRRECRRRLAAPARREPQRR